MRKSTIFISAVLTTFALVMLYRVASAYNDDQTKASAEPTAIPAPTEAEAPAPTEAALGPEEAAQLAAQVVGKTNLLSAESSNFNGVDAYMVTFTNNDIVYVGLDGEILGVQVAPVVINVEPLKKNKHKNNDGGGSQNVSNSSGGEEEHHESNEEHNEEEHED
jgi:hypothetical protein